jgi:hypothetical protein
MAWREREILERAVHTIAEQTAKADFIHEEIAIGHDRSDPSTRRCCGWSCSG